MGLEGESPNAIPRSRGWRVAEGLEGALASLERYGHPSLQAAELLSELRALPPASRIYRRRLAFLVRTVSRFIDPRWPSLRQSLREELERALREGGPSRRAPEAATLAWVESAAAEAETRLALLSLADGCLRARTWSVAAERAGVGDVEPSRDPGAAVMEGRGPVEAAADFREILRTWGKALVDEGAVRASRMARRLEAYLPVPDMGELFEAVRQGAEREGPLKALDALAELRGRLLNRATRRVGELIDRIGSLVSLLARRGYRLRFDPSLEERTARVEPAQALGELTRLDASLTNRLQGELRSQLRRIGPSLHDDLLPPGPLEELRNLRSVAESHIETGEVVRADEDLTVLGARFRAVVASASENGRTRCSRLLDGIRELETRGFEVAAWKESITLASGEIGTGRYGRAQEILDPVESEIASARRQEDACEALLREAERFAEELEGLGLGGGLRAPLREAMTTVDAHGRLERARAVHGLLVDRGGGVSEPLRVGLSMMEHRVRSLTREGYDCTDVFVDLFDAWESVAAFNLMLAGAHARWAEAKLDAYASAHSEALAFRKESEALVDLLSLAGIDTRPWLSVLQETGPVSPGERAERLRHLLGEMRDALAIVSQDAETTWVRVRDRLDQIPWDRSVEETLAARTEMLCQAGRFSAARDEGDRLLMDLDRRLHDHTALVSQLESHRSELRRLSESGVAVDRLISLAEAVDLRRPPEVLAESCLFVHMDLEGVRHALRDDVETCMAELVQLGRRCEDLGLDVAPAEPCGVVPSVEDSAELVAQLKDLRHRAAEMEERISIRERRNAELFSLEALTTRAEEWGVDADVPQRGVLLALVRGDDDPSVIALAESSREEVQRAIRAAEEVWAAKFRVIGARPHPGAGEIALAREKAFASAVAQAPWAFPAPALQSGYRVLEARRSLAIRTYDKVRARTEIIARLAASLEREVDIPPIDSIDTVAGLVGALRSLEGISSSVEDAAVRAIVTSVTSQSMWAILRASVASRGWEARPLEAVVPEAGSEPSLWTLAQHSRFGAAIAREAAQLLDVLPRVLACEARCATILEEARLTRLPVPDARAASRERFRVGDYLGAMNVLEESLQASESALASARHSALEALHDLSDEIDWMAAHGIPWAILEPVLQECESLVEMRRFSEAFDVASRGLEDGRRSTRLFETVLRDVDAMVKTTSGERGDPPVRDLRMRLRSAIRRQSADAAAKAVDHVKQQWSRRQERFLVRYETVASECRSLMDELARSGVGCDDEERRFEEIDGLTREGRLSEASAKADALVDDLRRVTRDREALLEASDSLRSRVVEATWGADRAAFLRSIEDAERAPDIRRGRESLHALPPEIEAWRARKAIELAARAEDLASQVDARPPDPDDAVRKLLEGLRSLPIPSEELERALARLDGRLRFEVTATEAQRLLEELDQAGHPSTDLRARLSSLSPAAPDAPAEIAGLLMQLEERRSSLMARLEEEATAALAECGRLASLGYEIGDRRDQMLLALERLGTGSLFEAQAAVRAGSHALEDLLGRLRDYEAAVRSIDQSLEDARTSGLDAVAWLHEKQRLTEGHRADSTGAAESIIRLNETVRASIGRIKNDAEDARARASAQFRALEAESAPPRFRDHLREPMNELEDAWKAGRHAEVIELSGAVEAGIEASQTELAAYRRTLDEVGALKARCRKRIKQLRKRGVDVSALDSGLSMMASLIESDRLDEARSHGMELLEGANALNEAYERFRAAKSRIADLLSALDAAGADTSPFRRAADTLPEADYEEGSRRAADLEMGARQALAAFRAQADAALEKGEALVEGVAGDDPSRVTYAQRLAAIREEVERGRYLMAEARAVELAAEVQDRLAFWERRVALVRELEAALASADSAGVDCTAILERADDVIPSNASDALSRLSALTSEVQGMVRTLRTEVESELADLQRDIEAGLKGFVVPEDVGDLVSRARTLLNVGALADARAAITSGSDALASAKDAWLKVRAAVEELEERLREASGRGIQVEDLVAELELARLAPPGNESLDRVLALSQSLEQREVDTRASVEDRVRFARSVVDELTERGIRATALQQKIVQAENVAGSQQYALALRMADEIASAAQSLEETFREHSALLEQVRARLADAHNLGVDVAGHAREVARARMVDDFTSSLRDLRQIHEALLREIHARESGRAPPASPPAIGVPSRPARERPLPPPPLDLPPSAPQPRAASAREPAVGTDAHLVAIAGAFPREAHRQREELMSAAEGVRTGARPAGGADLAAVRTDALKTLARFNADRWRHLDSLRRAVLSAAPHRAPHAIDLSAELDLVERALRQGLYVEADEVLRRVERILRESP